MKRPALPYLLLLPLLAVLLFGNCGGGVRGMLNSMSIARRAELRASVVRREQCRTLAAKQLHGRARQQAYQQIEIVANNKADSVLRRHELDKFNKRRNKTERQLLLNYNPDGSPRAFGKASPQRPTLGPN
ncbi:hypothetical protein Q5H92_00765 [Hymenobacter sp. M29]|uniref:Uncharacterized protein n=1 Tax=Hymenobacter mellowenesis TaxID=3063995 RepID=A0ABT9A4X7_9BACT|nr:hypothetical protein [Hymenobacter sp. M29]MDO7844870.1 hypothetical protein [Hymenobacter sp. M29]